MRSYYIPSRTSSYNICLCTYFYWVHTVLCYSFACQSVCLQIIPVVVVESCVLELQGFREYV